MKATGIRQLFCLPGVQNDPFFDAVVDARDWLEVIVTRHEQGCAYMAHGRGAGNGTADGDVRRARARPAQRVRRTVERVRRRRTRAGDRRADPFAAARQRVPRAPRARRPAGRAASGHEARGDRSRRSTPRPSRSRRRSIELVSGTPRPVAIEVPADLWAEAGAGHASGAGVRTMPSIDVAAVDAAAEQASRSAVNPLIWVGTGAQDASPAVRQLAELLQAPVSTRRMGHGVMDETDPLFVPMGLAHRMWADVDLVLGIGSRIEFPLLQWGSAGREPDPDQHRPRRARSPRHRRARHPRRRSGSGAAAASIGSPIVQRPDRRAELGARRAEFYNDIAHLEPQLSYLAAIRDALPDDAIIVEDVTQMTFVAHFAYQFNQPRTFLSSGFAGTLGAAVATGIGAKAGAPDRTVVTVTGDGGFLFTATELASAVQHDIRAITVVFNDNAFGNVRRIQQQRFGVERTIASTLVNPDIVAFAESFGCLGLRATIHTSSAMRCALRWRTTDPW